MVRLCTPRGGAAPSLSGSWFDVAIFVGKPGESILCMGYVSDGAWERNAIFQDLEENECQRYVEGAVTVGGVDAVTGFIICTQTSTYFTATRPELGVVVSGLELLRQAITHHTTDDGAASKIRIANAGVE